MQKFFRVELQLGAIAEVITAYLFFGLGSQRFSFFEKWWWLQ